MTKSDYQWQFVQCLGLLFGYAMFLGVKLTLGRGYVSPEANAAEGGHERSTHLHGLGQDLNLFVDIDDDGEPDYIRYGNPMWQKLGEYWESLHELARWGGRWGDHNHFSFEWQGVK